MKKSVSKLYLYGAIGCIVIVAIVGYLYCFSSFSKSSDTQYVYIDTDDNIDSVYNKVEPIANSFPYQAFKTLTHHFGYAGHIHTGRYAIHPGEGALKVWRHMKNGLQEPVNLTLPSVRTLNKLSAELSKKLMIDSTSILQALTDEATCEKYGYDTTTIACMFIPNTYDIYWNSSIKYAWKRFDLKRIYNNLLHIKSPYNTYVNPGLPPGPIRIPSVAGIDAVLNLVKHDYLYMCAKEDFSGTHNFARTYQEHLQNAAKYSKALNERGIK